MDIAINKFNIEDPGNRFVSLNPVISIELDRRRIPHTTTLDYGGSEERYRDGILAYSAVKRILEEIDNALSSGSGTTACPIKTASYSYYYVKILFDVIQTKVHLLREIIAKEQPQKIITFRCSQSEHQGIIPFSNDDSVFADLLALDGWNIPVICLPSEKKNIFNTPNHNRNNLLREYLIKNSAFFNLATIIKRKGLRYIIPVVTASIIHKKKAVVVYGSGYNWDDALGELYFAGLSPIIRYQNAHDCENRAEKERGIQDSIGKICNSSDFINRQAIMYGIDTRPLLFRKLSILLARTFNESLTAYQQFSVFLRTQHPRCLLLSTQADHTDRAIIKAAHDYGIPVISWQHGGGGYCYHPMMPFAEFIDSDIHLVFGEAVKQSYVDTAQRLEIPSSPNIIPVGSSSLDNIKKEFHEKSQTKETGLVLYVTTIFLNNRYYISDRWEQCSFDENLWSTQKKILGFAQKFPLMKFVIKLHPSQNKNSAIHQYAADLGVRNVTFVIDEKTISQLVQEVDMVIFDINSTGLLQALPSKKPIFIFSGLENHDKHTLNLLKKRAFVYGNNDALIKGLEEFLGSGLTTFTKRMNVDCNNTEFLEEYGTFRNDGKSASRAAHIVKEMVTSETSSCQNKYRDPC